DQGQGRKALKLLPARLSSRCYEPPALCELCKRPARPDQIIEHGALEHHGRRHSRIECYVWQFRVCGLEADHALEGGQAAKPCGQPSVGDAASRTSWCIP